MQFLLDGREKKEKRGVILLGGKTLMLYSCFGSKREKRKGCGGTGSGKEKKRFPSSPIISWRSGEGKKEKSLA